MDSLNDIFKRTELLVGHEAMDFIASRSVILFGTGGVGSWCAEGLVRSGIRKLTIVDFDTVSASNINRQLVATSSTVGQVKVDVLRKRLLDINPLSEIIAVKEAYNVNTAEKFHIGDYDYIVDAIDCVKDKALLILNACNTESVFFSSMGAALKSDPTRIAVTEFWKVHGCPLARALRNRFKHNRQMPQKKFQCVYSDELLKNNESDKLHEANGTFVHVTAIFGFMLAGL
ncbi:MAG: tRNA threonylcarbamoyladenosine dehydratase, partial [Prevotella sp.]|nr:tRNA threonylcarbamoyladenosine dehydratase [Prevotella sp.]